jgi:hypothetical protein
MAIVKGPIQMTGSIAGVSFYTRRGSDKVIMRTKGGVSKEKMAKAPQYESLRKNQQEWRGCTKFGSLTRYAFGGLHRLADYNLTSVLNGMGKNLMKLDTESELGKRRLQLSKFKQALEGFNFNRNYPFNSVLRVGFSCEINRELLQATVQVPRINAANDILNIQRLPYFRLIVVLGTVTDWHFSETDQVYVPIELNLNGINQVYTSPWFQTQGIVPEQTLTVQMKEAEQALVSDEITVLVSMGIEFGTVGFTGDPVEVKYAGCGKVIAVR